ncbi:zinc-dependent alcohol dehydrogenase family protein [Mycobacterium sp. BMJ-28]
MALNYRDLAMIYGRYFPDAPDGLIPVSDAVGEVVALGPEVTRFSAGDRVLNVFNPKWFAGPYPGTLQHEYGTAVDGWLTEYKVVSEESLELAPSALNDAQAATLSCAGVTAWTALTGPNPITATDTILTQGTGGVSLFAVQIAKAIGAKVISTTSTPEKAELLRTLGADEVLNYLDNPQWSTAVRSATGGRGVDRIIEVGGAATMRESLRCGHDATEIDLIGFLGQGNWGLQFAEFFDGSYEWIRRIRVGSRQDTRSFLKLLQVNTFKPVIDSTFAFEGFAEAFHRLDNRTNIGKVIIAMP